MKFFRLSFFVPLLFVLALLLRLRSLDRPLDFDEGLHAYYSYFLYQHHYYEYLLDLHGPFLYYLTAGVFGLAGPSVAAARAAVAVAGAALVLLPWALRHRVGTAGALAASALLTLSPLFISQSNQLRNDVLVALFLLGALAAADAYLRRRRWWALWAGALALSLALATKETALVAVGLWAPALVLAFTPRLREMVGWLRRLFRERWYELVAGAFVFALVSALLFSFFLRDFGAAAAAWLEAPRFWAGASLGGFRNPGLYHGPGYYLGALAPADLLLLTLGIGGGALLWRRSDRFLRFLVAWMVLGLVLFTALPYKADRLALNFLLPAALVAGAAVGRLGSARRKFIAVAAVAALSLASLPAPEEGPGDYGRLEATVRAFHPTGGNATLILPVTADPKYGIYWPLPWHIRDEEFQFLRVGPGVSAESLAALLEQIERQRPGTLFFHDPRRIAIPEAAFRNLTQIDFPGAFLVLHHRAPTPG